MPVNQRWRSAMPNRTVLITGASSGIGEAAARRFLDRGWHVVATMRDPARSRLEATDRAQLAGHPLDAGDEAWIEAGVRSADERVGRIAALVNNAGMGL